MAEKPAGSVVAGSGRSAFAAAGLPDGALLQRIARGDQAAFRELAGRHLAAVLATARRMLADAAEAEDVAQEVMLRLWSAAGTITVGEAGLRPWLKRVGVNLAIDRLRARRRLEVTDAPPELPDAPTQGRGLQEATLAARVNAALARLPERQRIALTLFHFEGLSQAEVGRALQVSDEAVESLLARARRALKQSLKDEWQALLPEAEE